MLATSQTDSEAVMTVNEAMFFAELQYQTTLAIAKSLRSRGLLTEEEYAEIDTKLRTNLSPSLGTLLSENPLI